LHGVVLAIESLVVGFGQGAATLLILKGVDEEANQRPRVLALLEDVIAFHGAPATLRMANGPECLATSLWAWAEGRGIRLKHIQPGKPAQNALIEDFNQTYRQEVLDANVFNSLAEVRAITADWIPGYNTERPHDSLGWVPHLTFLPRPTTQRIAASDS
jgi:putative transposase